MSFVHNIQDAVTSLQEQIDLLQKKSDNIVAKPMKFEVYPAFNDKVYTWCYPHNSWGTWDLRTEFYYKGSGQWSSFPKVFTQQDIDTALSKFDETTKEWHRDCESIRATNSDVATHNKIQKDRVISIMKTIGVSEIHSTYGYKTTRSRKMTDTRQTAGYLGDLGRVLPTSDNYDILLKQLKSKRDDIESFGKNLLVKSQKEAYEQKKIEDDKLKVNQMAALRAKYTPDNYDSDIEDIKESLLSKNKYLHLAYWLERNRGDWNDGYSYAETGLAGFTAETGIDRLIENDIQSCINSSCDGIDGRVFRDTEYNYSVLYGMVEDNALLKDLELVQKYEDIY